MEIKTHPKYNNYEFSTDGKYRMIGKTDFLTGSIARHGYMLCSISAKGEKHDRKLVSRSMWETFKGEIPEGYEIDHINDIKTDNRLENLQCISISENRKKAQKNNSAFRDKAKEAHKLQRNIKATNLQTGEERYFVSKSQAGKYTGCSPALVYRICERKAKTFGGTIAFEYFDGDIKTVAVTHIQDARVGKSKYTPEEKKEHLRKRSNEQYQEKKLKKNSIIYSKCFFNKKIN